MAMIQCDGSDPNGQAQGFQSHYRSTRGILEPSENVVEDIDQSKRAYYRRSKSMEIKPQDMLLHYSARERQLQVGPFRRFSGTERVRLEQVQASRLKEDEYTIQHPAWAGTCVIVSQMMDSTNQQLHGWVASNTVGTSYDEPCKTGRTWASFEAKDAWRRQVHELQVALRKQDSAGESALWRSSVNKVGVYVVRKSLRSVDISYPIIPMSKGGIVVSPGPEACVFDGWHLQKLLHVVAAFGSPSWQTVPGALFVLDAC
jgi:hypothetical protein